MYGLTFDSLDLHKWIKTRREQITQVWILVLNNTDMECFGCHSSVCSTVECFGCDKSVCSTRVAGHYGKVWVVHLLSEASTWLARTSSVRSHPSPSQWTSSLCVRFVCFCLPGFLGLSIFFCPHSICCAEKQCNITWHKETLWREKLFADPMFQSAYKLVILLFLLTFAAVFVCFVCVSVSL